MFKWFRKRRASRLTETPLLKNHYADVSKVWSIERASCSCLEPQYESTDRWPPLQIHTEVQDRTLPAWHKLLQLVDDAAADSREEFAPAKALTPDEWNSIIELPSDIGRLKAVKYLLLYGSSLVRLPVEIGEMTSLERFDPYTSYRLHWFPYEITRCEHLRNSTVSTRALYGNHNYDPPFPQLPQATSVIKPASCSVCRSPFGNGMPIQRWLTRRVGTDNLPLLVHACSTACVGQLTAKYEPHGITLHTGPRPTGWVAEGEDH